MDFKPHDYQNYAIEYIKEKPITAVFLSMGLGKTIISLTAIADLMFDSFEVHKTLIIGPLRVARDSWPMEISKWSHLSHLTFAVAVGTLAERKAALARQADITIINRENVDWLVESGNFDYDMVVIDELSSFKNHTAKRFKALMKVRPKVKRIVGLTGTPSSNGLMDLWSEFKLLDMGERLGKFITRYRENYFVPDKRNGERVFSYRPREGAEDEIYRRISDITISMKCTDHLKMPELISSQYEVILSDDERKQYERLKSELALDVSAGEITVANAAALTNKLSQLANGAIYDDDKNTVEFHSRKLDAMEDIIESANGNPLLVAYWFKHDFERISKRFEVREIKTSKDIADNLQSGGSTLVWFGLTWSLELYQQTNARLWRQGQSAGTVVIQHIIAKGTIDERVLKALSKKELTQNALIDAVKANLGEKV